MKCAVDLLFAGAGGAAAVRVSELTATEVAWMHDHEDYTRGVMLVAPPVLSAQPARWLSAMRWIDHCQGECRRRQMERAKNGR